MVSWCSGYHISFTYFKCAEKAAGSIPAEIIFISYYLLVVTAGVCRCVSFWSFFVNLQEASKGELRIGAANCDEQLYFTSALGRCY